MRTEAAKAARKSVVERFGLPNNAPFTECARLLIDTDHLWVEPRPSNVADACAFLTSYEQMRKSGRLPRPRADLAAGQPAK